MATVVEHDKRKQEILERALDVFISEGYEDVTFQKIADRCGITRTTLYIYFKNKREIFLWSIKQLLSNIEDSLMVIIQKSAITAQTMLQEILNTILDACYKNKKLFNVVLAYLIQLKKSGINPDEVVRRRVIKVKHLLSIAIIKGIRSGEFKRVNIKEANDMFYGLLESAIFKMAVLNQSSITEVYGACELSIQGLLAN